MPGNESVREGVQVVLLLGEMAELYAIASVGLGSVEGDVGGGIQLGSARQAVPCDDPDRAGLTVRHAGTQTLCDKACPLDRADGEQDGELLAADTSEQVRTAHALGPRARRVMQKPVSLGMPWLSLYDLKWSMSISIRLRGCDSRRARGSSRSSVSCQTRRFANPVSVSMRARSFRRRISSARSNAVAA